MVDDQADVRIKGVETTSGAHHARSLKVADIIVEKNAPSTAEAMEGAGSSATDQSARRSTMNLRDLFRGVNPYDGSRLESVPEGAQAVETPSEAVSEVRESKAAAEATQSGDWLKSSQAALDDRDGEPTIAGIHRYVAPMITGSSQVVSVKMTVKETTSEKQPNPLYSIETLKIESRPSVLSRVTPDESGSHPQGGFSENVRRALAAVNPETVSTTIDANGEPEAMREYSFHRFPANLPTAFRRELASWKTISKSPYSDSFYNIEGKTWGNTPQGIIRISDHWNFYSQGERHCVTDRPVRENTHWVKAQ